MPASLENAARWKPTISTPTMPPATPSGVNAPLKMSTERPRGSASKLPSMTTRQAAM